MSEIDRLDSCPQHKAKNTTRNYQVILLTVPSRAEGKIKGFETDGVNFIRSPFNSSKAFIRIYTHLIKTI